jgi:hypothetical protein
MHYHNDTCFGHIRPSSGNTNSLCTNRISFFPLRHWCFHLHIIFEMRLFLCFVRVYCFLYCAYQVSLLKRHVSFKVCTQMWTAFLIFHTSIRIDCNRISEGLLHYYYYYHNHHNHSYKVKLKLYLCLIKQAPHNADAWGSGGTF